MSKKHKIKKKITVPETSSETKPVSKPGPVKTSSGSSFLILFDKKTKIFLLFLFLTYIVLSSLKIHTSNIAYWDIFFGADKSESVIAGEPQLRRMDEWMISTPGAIGQYQAGLPLTNSSVGDLKAPLVWGLPVKDVSSALRPAIWSYFIFDVERAFAFAWNFNIFFFLISTFLLFMLLTRNNFLLSVTGTFFIFFSGGIQWWSYFISNYMLYLNGMFISIAYLLYNKKLIPLIIAGLVFLLSAYGFIFNLYPPFQVPLLWLYLFLFAGFLMQRKNFGMMKERRQLKSIIFAASLIILIGFTYHYYNLVKDTYSAMLNTVYPGRRFSTGGDVANGKLFAEFFGIFMNDNYTPPQWMNVCEASGFIMFFPIVFYAIGYYYYKTKKTDPLLISVSVFLLVGLIYVLIGFPGFLSKITLFSMSPGTRALPIVGVGSSMLLICYLSSEKTRIKNEKISRIEFVVVAISVLLFMLVVVSFIHKSTQNFFSKDQTTIAVSLAVITYLLTRYKNFRFVLPALCIFLIGWVLPNAAVNPVTQGLAPVLENQFALHSRKIHKKDPKARWAVFANTRLTHILKANGINLFNSVKLVPPMEDMKVLDPGGKYDSIYNRYAWMALDSKQYFEFYNINARDTMIFNRFGYQDSYVMFTDPCSSKLKQIGVKYFVFDYIPDEREVRCMTKLDSIPIIIQDRGKASKVTISIYKRNDQ